MYIQVPQHDGPDVLLNTDHPPTRVVPGTGPFVRLTFHDGVELNINVHWHEIAHWFTRQVHRLGASGGAWEVIDHASPAAVDALRERRRLTDLFREAPEGPSPPEAEAADEPAPKRKR